MPSWPGVVLPAGSGGRALCLGAPPREGGGQSRDGQTARGIPVTEQEAELPGGTREGRARDATLPACAPRKAPTPDIQGFQVGPALEEPPPPFSWSSDHPRAQRRPCFSPAPPAPLPPVGSGSPLLAGPAGLDTLSHPGMCLTVGDPPASCTFSYGILGTALGAGRRCDPCYRGDRGFGRGNHLSRVLTGI